LPTCAPVRSRAAAAQIGKFYGLPTSTAAGMSDSKIPDAQAGYEKGVTAVLAALAGCNRVCESAGMLGSLMGCSFESLVIDNDMLGMVQRALRGIEVTDETLSVEAIKEVAIGAGPYLGHPQTLSLMETEYLYPALGDRQPQDTWEEEGSKDMLTRASERVESILADHYPNYIEPAIDAAIRERFPIQLTPQAMQPGNGRW
jgi:trimethylamine--corrinoid protein Co-methyltransferase